MTTNDSTPLPPFPIVGIGASAGGLEALKEFFTDMPDRTGAAFVVVTHHDPHQPCLIGDLLAKKTHLPVIEIGDGTPVEADHIYICPAAYHVSLESRRLVFQEAPHGRDVTLPIDFFLRSLASQEKERAVCVILSGAGSDGTLGLRAIKGEGGMAMAQDPATAQHNGMPGSAIATDLVDYTLPPAEMPAALMRYLHDDRSATTPHLPLQENIAAILSILRLQTGNDFSYYKTNTLCRRIERRMNVHRIGDPRQYARYLRENAHEVELLFKELLIGVTSFFRDAEAFAAIEQKALPALLENKALGDPVRIWVAGCSTGEEAYSLAMLCQEYIEREQKPLNVQIFATDLDERAIHAARAGLYTDGIALDVSEERRRRFFTTEDGHYRIRKAIREMVVFAPQNIIQDPSFTKLDLISCRNLLIYLDGRIQKRVMPLFHYSLRPGGVLFLGSSESVGGFTDLFEPVSNRSKIFRRRETPLSAGRLSTFMDRPKTESPPAPRGDAVPRPPVSLSDVAQKLLLREHVPPSVIVNERGEIFFIHGRTGRYLEPSAGTPQPSQNLLDMAREGLQLPLTVIIRKASTQEGEIRHPAVRVKTNGHYAFVSVRASKIAEPEALRGLIWIAFEEEAETHDAADKDELKPRASEDEPLERELHYIKQNLQSTIEELETANEELKSTNEELQSTNEELQSANEELETAKEEMQSLNEELQTVNLELETKIQDLSYANDDMKNLLNSTGIATLFLDNQLHIKRFTVQAKKIVHLIQTDIGRPIQHIVSELEYDALVADATEVLQTLVFKEIEVRARDWSWYLMRIMPYRTADNVIDGLVLTFVDITHLKRSDILLSAHDRAVKLFAREAGREQILDGLAEVIEQQSPGIWCAVAIYDAQAKRLTHLSAPSLPHEFNRVLENLSVSAEAHEPCAQAAFHRRSIVVPDIANDTAPSPFHELALQHHIKAAWSLPICSSDDTLLGVFSIYYRQAHRPSNIEEEVIQRTVPLIATAIMHPPKDRP